MIFKFFTFFIISEVLDIIIYILFLFWGYQMIRKGSNPVSRMWYLFFSFFPIISQLFLRLSLVRRTLTGSHQLGFSELARIMQFTTRWESLTILIGIVFTISMLTMFIILSKRSRPVINREVSLG